MNEGVSGFRLSCNAIMKIIDTAISAITARTAENIGIPMDSASAKRINKPNANASKPEKRNRFSEITTILTGNCIQNTINSAEVARFDELSSSRSTLSGGVASIVWSVALFDGVFLLKKHTENQILVDFHISKCKHPFWCSKTSVKANTQSSQRNNIKPIITYAE